MCSNLIMDTINQGSTWIEASGVFLGQIWITKSTLDELIKSTFLCFNLFVLLHNTLILTLCVTRTYSMMHRMMWSMQSWRGRQVALVVTCTTKGDNVINGLELCELVYMNSPIGMVKRNDIVYSIKHLVMNILKINKDDIRIPKLL